MINIPELLGRMRKRRILVIGDLMLDHYILGDVHRISPEAPVPVVQATQERRVAGGAANVAANLLALGVQTEVIGVVGEDEPGRALIDLLGKLGVAAGRCIRNPAISTIVKTRVVARNQQVCRIDFEGPRSGYALSPHEAANAMLEVALDEADAVILSDYAKGVVTQDLLDRVRDRLAGSGKLWAVDPKPARALDLRGAGLMKPNRSEALQLAGLAEPGRGEPYPLEDIGARIHAAWAPEILVITLGADGIAVFRQGRLLAQLPTEAREVFDVSGAGDTVVAILACALSAGADPVDAAKLANLAAGVVVSKMGTATVTEAELVDAG
jgi:D-beta-D-heptose 7-phosphate kinase/D-beta-D-heptose 1-phosphate adenosyltransferase